MQVDRKLRIAIDCRIDNFRQGMGTAIFGLAKAFSESGINSQEYTFIVRKGLEDQLAPYVYGPCSVQSIPDPAFSYLKAAVRWIKPLQFLWNRFLKKVAYIPESDGYVESQNFDVVHFLTAFAYLTDVPTVYHLHDLQHRHFPHFFSKNELALRERHCQTYMQRASFVCVLAEWTKQDVMDKYDIDPRKIVVVKWGAAIENTETISPEAILSVVRKYNLPSQFFFFPAVTWPHKNHEVIVSALQILKERYGRLPHVYFTGQETDFYATVRKQSIQASVSGQLHHLGFVPQGDLEALYQTATALIYPSKFEGFGLPILEAFHAGLPVLSSNSSVLPEIAQDAALYFDPVDPEQLASLMLIMLDDESARHTLREKGRKVLSQYSFKKTASELQNIYARVAEEKGVLQSQ